MEKIACSHRIPKLRIRLCYAFGTTEVMYVELANTYGTISLKEPKVWRIYRSSKSGSKLLSLLK